MISKLPADDECCRLGLRLPASEVADASSCSATAWAMSQLLSEPIQSDVMEVCSYEFFGDSVRWRAPRHTSTVIFITNSLQPDGRPRLNYKTSQVLFKKGLKYNKTFDRLDRVCVVCVCSVRA